MTTATHSSTTTTSVTPRILHGVVGGLAGGVVFGLLMQTMGMMPMIAMLVGSKSLAVAWILHLAISAFAGALFGLVLGRRATGYGTAAALGMVYGIVWWVVGALLLMPLRMGMDPFVLNPMAWQSLMGHLLFGLVLGLVYAALARRQH